MSIHIKKKNRGKFTKSARAAGEGVQGYAHKIINNSKVSKLQKKRANFAIQAKKWHHAQDGAILPNEKDYPDLESYQQAIDSYMAHIPKINDELFPELSQFHPIDDSSIQYPNPEFNISGMGQNRIQEGIARGIIDNPMGYGGNDNKDYYSGITAPQRKAKIPSQMNWGNAALTALSVANEIVPQPKAKDPVVFPKKIYTSHPYGTSSQAIAKKGKKMGKAQDGVTLSNTGYKRNSKDKDKASLRIPSNHITMEGVDIPLHLKASNGEEMVLHPGDADVMFPNAEYVDETPLAKKGKKVQGQYISKSYQSGGRLPITTTNPSDPRLKSYNDSLANYNTLNKFQKNAKLILDTSSTADIYGKAWNDYYNKSQKKGFSFLNGLDVNHPTSISKTYPDGSEGVYKSYKSIKPVQPVIYQEPQSSFIPGLKFKGNVHDNIDDNMNVGTPTASMIPKMQPIEQNSNTPTKWSFTYPTGNYNEHKTIYFPDEKSWKEFTKDQRASNSQQGQDWGTSTGYMQNGGNMSGNGLQIEDDKFTPISDSTIMINGDSHKEGGTLVRYGGKTIEAEKGEPLSIDGEGNAVIYGNMKNPITGNKFKTDAMNIGKKERKLGKLLDYSTELVKSADPYNKWGNLKFNAGQAMMMGAKMKSKQLSSLKEHLSDVQSAMLELSGEDVEVAKNGLKMAQRGMQIDGGGRVTYKKWLSLHNQTNDASTSSMSLAQKHNNPGNLMYSKWEDKYGAVAGQPRYDKTGKLIGYYAKFPDLESGKGAMKSLLTSPSYRGLTVAEASKKWTGEGVYGNIPSSIRDKKIGDLSDDELVKALDTFTLGEDSKHYNWNGVDTPNAKLRTLQPETPYETGRVNSPQFQPIQPDKVNNGEEYKYNWNINTPKDIPVGTNAKPLEFKQLMGEAYAAATNREQPVWLQQYDPELYQSYQVSFQDRRNRITAQGRASRQYLGDNPNAQASVAAGEYDALSNIDAEEFRTNQGIEEDITNKNIALMNDAQLKNLQLADTQYTRQAQSKSRTKETNQTLLNSISGKLLQNELENRSLQVYENLYPHYRYNDDYQLQKVGNPGQDYLNLNGIGGDTGNINDSKTTRYDANNHLTSTSVTEPSPLKTETDEEKLKALKQTNIQGYFNRQRSKNAKMGVTPGVNLFGN